MSQDIYDEDMISINVTATKRWEPWLLILLSVDTLLWQIWSPLEIHVTVIFIGIFITVCAHCFPSRFNKKCRM